jgi:spore maturation protein SpmA
MKTVWKILAWISLSIGLFMLAGIPVTLSHANYSRSDIPILVSVGLTGVFLFLVLLSTAKVIELLEKLVEQTKPVPVRLPKTASDAQDPQSGVVLSS